MALWENCIGYGLHADRPATGAPGAIYCESDTGKMYRDNGVAWIQVATSAAGTYTVHSTAIDYTIPSAEYLVVVTAAGVTITLPDAASNVGRSVELFVGPNNATLAAAGSDRIDSDTTSTTTLSVSEGAVIARSTGAHWCIVGGF